ncbi:MAG: hypothetical protein ACK4TA_14170 [Saprospiraceae bacterium]
MQKIVTTFAILFFGICHFAAAQAVAANFTTEIKSLETFESPVATTDDWTIFADAENKLYYIDFETLKVNVSDVLVRNEKGELVWKDHVFNLPVNTIYELDFSRFKAGTYEIELRTFTGAIRKKIAFN